MSDATICDRCDERGPHKGSRERTPAFPGVATVEAFHFGEHDEYRAELCADCTIALAAFLGFEDVKADIEAANADGSGEEGGGEP